MASILVLAKDLPNAGRVEGDPVSVRGDNETVTSASGTWHWSAEEDIARWIAEGNLAANFPDLFYVVDIPGLQKGRAKRIMQSRFRLATVIDPEFTAPDRSDRVVAIEKHRWTLRISDRLTAQERTKVRRDRKLSIANDTVKLNNVIVDRSGEDVFITDAPKDPRPANR